MKFTRKMLVVAVGSLVLVVGMGLLTVTHTLKLAAFTGAGHGTQGAATASKASAVAASASPSVSPSTTPGATAKPSPSTRYLDVQSGPCQGIHASDDGCVQKNTTFSIASVNLNVASVSCSGNMATVVFNPLTATRYYLAGGGGNAVVQVDYSDGTSSPVITLPFTTSSDIQNYSGLTHTFPITGTTPSFQVRLTSPNAITVPWQLTNPISGVNCAAPSPSPSPYYPPSYPHM